MICTTVKVVNFPAHFKAKELRNLFESSLLMSSSRRSQPFDLISQKAVVGCSILNKDSNKENLLGPALIEAEVTFADEELANQALLLNGVFVG